MSDVVILERFEIDGEEMLGLSVEWNGGITLARMAEFVRQAQLVAPPDALVQEQGDSSFLCSWPI